MFVINAIPNIAQPPYLGINLRFIMVHCGVRNRGSRGDTFIAEYNPSLLSGISILLSVMLSEIESDTISTVIILMMKI